MVAVTAMRTRACLILLAMVVCATEASAQLLDRVVAVVDEEIITQRELEQRARIVVQQLQQAQIPLPEQQELVRQVLEAMVLGRLQVRYAQRAGLAFDNAAVDAQIEQLAQYNQITLEQFRRQVELGGVRFPEFRAYMYEKAVVEQLQYVVSRQRVQVSETEIDHFLRLDQNLLEDDVRYRVRHILVSVPSSSNRAQTAEARDRIEQIHERVQGGEPFAAIAVLSSDGQNALSGGDLGWRVSAELPAIASTEISLLEPGDATDVIRSPSGFHLFYLEAREGGGGEVLLQQTRSRHILQVPDAVTTIEEVRERLTDLRERVLAGDSFEDLARAHSKDTASAVEGGDLGWRSPGELHPVFENRMSQLRPGEVSEPFETSFGWHIVRVEERREIDSTQQSLRLRATNYIARSQVGDVIQLWLRQLREDAYVRYLMSLDDESS